MCLLEFICHLLDEEDFRARRKYIFEYQNYKKQNMEESINEKIAKVNIVETDESWFGHTYKEEAIEKVKKLIEARRYPSKLW